jgi:hypothetical protein
MALGVAHVPSLHVTRAPGLLLRSAHSIPFFLLVKWFEEILGGE